MKIDILRDALKPFADLCSWLEQEQEMGPDGEVWGTFDEEILLDNEGGFMFPDDCVTAGMIRQARTAMELTDGT